MVCSARESGRCARGDAHEAVRTGIVRFVAEANANPRPFRRTKNPDKIIAAIWRGHQALDSLH